MRTNNATRTTPETKLDDWLTIREAADWLKCTSATIRRMIDRGELRAYRFSERVIRIRRTDILAAAERVESLAVSL